MAGLSADPEKSATTGGWAGGEKGLLSFIEVSVACFMRIPLPLSGVLSCHLT